jgi:outer membrane protein assembly factor BamB
MANLREQGFCCLMKKVTPETLPHRRINVAQSSQVTIESSCYSSGNPLYALDARTGKQLWEQRLPDGPVYFGDLQRRNGVVCVNTGAALALAGGQAIPLDYFRVFAFDAKTGTLRWQISLGVLACDIPGPCSPQIEASESHLYVLTRKRPYALQVFDAQTGKAVGQHPIAIPVKEGLEQSALSNDVLYVRSSVHEGDPYSSGSSTSFTHYFIYAIRLANGATNWKYDIGSLLDVHVSITTDVMIDT